MEDGSYSYLGNKLGHKLKKAPVPLLMDSKKSLSELGQKDWEILNEDEIKLAFFYELKLLLEKVEIEALCTGILDIQRYLENIKDRVDSKTQKKVPDLKRFFQRLSPVLLRAFLETKREGKTDLEGPWKEAIQVVLEEEILEHQ